jgi:carbon-monoxide dehydrogenase medium subunit
MRLFEYHRPTTVPEAVGLLAELGDEAALLAGGTSLMNMAKLGLAEPEHVVALGEIPELFGLAPTSDGGIRLGAMTSLRDVELSPRVRRIAPGLSEAAAHVATVRIRNQATVGGNLVHADPNQDLPPMLMVHDAVVGITGPSGSREVPVSDLFLGFFETVVEPGEVVRSVSVPPSPEGFRAGYLKFLPRTRDDYSTIAVAAGLTVVDGRVGSARLAVAGGGSTPVRCRVAEDGLVGSPVDEDTIDDDTIDAVAEAVQAALDPVSDGRGSAGYKREMARVCTARLVRRLVAEAAA